MLDITDFRNIQRARLNLHADLNLIIGANASGKTSLLEALYYLGRARSFRTRLIKPLIYQQSSQFQLVAFVHKHERQIPIGIQRSVQTATIRLDGKPARSLAQLASHLPILLLTPDSHRLLDEGPQQRRHFLDWGLFHTQSGFWSLWQRYKNTLKQRNAALRQSAPERTIQVWDAELAVTGEQLSTMRNELCEQLLSELKPLAERILDFKTISLDYRQGWGQELSLAQALQRDRALDRQHGYTRHGPQRADFILRINGRSLTESVSRGQQKLLVVALILAQARLYQRLCQQRCILLIDDLPAELDQQSRQRVMQCLSEQPLQLLISAIEADALPLSMWSQYRCFEMQNGEVRQA